MPDTEQMSDSQLTAESVSSRYAVTLAAQLFTTCQITFSVMPSPQTEPFRLTHRNSRPSVIGADVTQMSIADFTQSGTGTVRM